MNEKVHPSEMPDGDYGDRMGNVDVEKVIRTKTGDDGVEETHIEYKPRRPKSYSIPK